MKNICLVYDFVIRAGIVEHEHLPRIPALIDADHEMAGRLDAVSVSLNAPTSEKYMELCHPAFGPESFGHIIRFTEDIKQYIDDVTMSVVSSAISRDDIEKCRIIAEKLGVRFRIR